ncbi:MAG: C40 family peptidase [Micavibrio aeruginosavorus]|uniref:C40 family peptidase n=1 Tax=Micavibrio aeruginosavorus TaxID=349221 RepID=A0A7T5R124_9BACT|nr:MAG: C40 family peptidase [Micavibrio aeruginosavorus]
MKKTAPHITIATTADILEAPALSDHIGRRESQLLLGEVFNVEAREGDFLRGYSRHDGYRGYVHKDRLRPEQARATHVCSHHLSIIHTGPGIKTRDIMAVSHLSRLRIEKNSLTNGFLKVVGLGWIPAEHVAPVQSLRQRIDHVERALDFLGTPYRYGGRSSLGIDCSGLVQIVLTGSGYNRIPRDADRQEKSSHVGIKIDPALAQRGDIVFFPQHVGIMVGKDTIISATEKYSGVVIETLDELAARQGGITAVRRPRP